MITLLLLSFGRSQQTQDSWAETDRIPIFKRCNDVRIVSSCRVMLVCSNHVLPDIHFLNMKFGWTKYNGNVMAHLPFKLCVPIWIIVQNFYYDLQDKILYWTKNDSNMIAHSTNCRYGPHMKIVSKHTRLSRQKI